MTILSIIIVLLLLWIILDFYFGYKEHKKQHPFEINKPKHSDLHLFTVGHRFFAQLKKDIDQAKDHIHMSFFIFREDTLGKEMIELLKHKASQGVKVRLLVDYMGSLGLKKKTLRDFKHSGIDFAYAAKPSFPYLFFSINRRNHRKITVIDGHIGYVGGFNVGDEYLGKDPRLGFWQDYHLHVTGEGVADLQQCFIHDWKQSKKDSFPHHRHASYFPKLNKGSGLMELIPTSGYVLEDLFIERINKAKQTLFIGSPYFIPSEKLQQALMNALDRGVQMTVLLPFKKDHPFVKPASYHYIQPLLKKGCRIYHFYQGFYHAKVFIVDGKMCHLGTANFDMRSLFLNDEMNGFFYDRELIDKIIGMTEEDINRSIKITLEQIQQRSFIEKSKTTLSNLLAPLL